VTPAERAAATLDAAERVAAVVRGDVPAPPRGRLAYLQHVGRTIEADLARFNDPED
jgi:hypothetical protein